LQVQIEKAPVELSFNDRVAQSLCNLLNSDGIANRLIDGFFTIPYSEDNRNIEEGKKYYFDSVTVIEGQNPIFQIYSFRVYGYKADCLIEELHKVGLEVREQLCLPNKEENE
jgi:hypothetical protein